jgi:hypothetical protein
VDCRSFHATSPLNGLNYGENTFYWDAAPGATQYRVTVYNRRYPMAFALGALAFLVLGIVGFSRPDDPTPWLVAVLAGAAVYAVALAGRLRRPPIEIPRLAATLPISAAAISRAKLTWVVAWATVFIAIPVVFVAARLV